MIMIHFLLFNIVFLTLVSSLRSLLFFIILLAALELTKMEGKNWEVKNFDASIDVPK